MINCLLLGFEGRYRVLDNGRTQLETIKQRLWQMIRGVRGSYPAPLSTPGRSSRAQAVAADGAAVGLSRWPGLSPACSTSFSTGVLATTQPGTGEDFYSLSCLKPPFSNLRVNCLRC